MPTEKRPRSTIPESGSENISNHGDDLDDQTEGEVEDEVPLMEDSETEDQDQEHESGDRPCIMWTGYGKKTPVLIFSAQAIIQRVPELKAIGEKHHMAYKMVKTECKLIRTVLVSHGFHETHPNSNDFNLMWTGSHLKPYTLRGLHEFQKVNHFPRSYEITRKDRLYKNVQRMQQLKGFKNFDFVPQSFIIPGEFQDFCSSFLKDKSPWIVKPIASSRGRGIFLVNHPEQVPLDETLIVSKYLANPLVIDGFKFDVRLYVAVTSYDPLIVYLYEEGLTRFATVRYDKQNRNIRNQCMHLTNYSVNKKNSEYVRNDDPDIEDYGNKWSLGALLRYLRTQGKDTTAMMLRIEDVVIKTLLSAELPIATACKMFMPHRGNCFELYGFDILLDDNMRPWVLEVNLSPSLACDSPLDLKIKSNMLSDLFSLTGFMCQDPMQRKIQQSRRNQEVLGKVSRPQFDRAWKPGAKPKPRPQSANVYPTSKFSTRPGMSATGLTGEEIRIVRRAKEENLRRGGWLRIFPSPDSWELYSSFFQSSSTHNALLYQQLYPEKAKNMIFKTSGGTPLTSAGRAKTVHLHSSAYPNLNITAQLDDMMAAALQRSLQYERKLSCLGDKPNRPRSDRWRPVTAGLPLSNSSNSPIGWKPYDQTELYKFLSGHSSARSRPALTQGIPSDYTPSNAFTNEPSTPSNDSQQYKAMTDSFQPQPSAQMSAARTPAVGSENKDSEPKKPAAQQPKYNVVQLLEKGLTISKVQARFAFATYLSRVQQRLMSETGTTEQEDVDTANEQMDLVLRFLKRAAGNLQQPFKVIVPSRKLVLNDRRRILAKQLADFVFIYNKETDHLKQRQVLEKRHIKHSITSASNKPVETLNEDRFAYFVTHGSEAELEEVLTTYTRLNKSASIFLGSNSKSNYSQASGSSISSGSLHQRSHSASARTPSGSESATRRRTPQSELTVDNKNLLDQQSQYSTSTTQRASSYSGAVSAYSGKVSMASSTRSRPASASNKPPIPAQRQRDIIPPTSHRERPDGAESTNDHKSSETSANSNKPYNRQHSEPGNGNKTYKSHGSESTNNSKPYKQNSSDSLSSKRENEVINSYENGMTVENSLNAALQKLNIKQQQRQYQPKPVVAEVLDGPEDGSDYSYQQSSAQSLRTLDVRAAASRADPTDYGYNPVYNGSVQSGYASTNRHRMGQSTNFDATPQATQTKYHDSDRLTRSLNVGERSRQNIADETFESFIDDSVPYLDPDIAAAYNHVTGTPPLHGSEYTPSKESEQFKIAMQSHYKQTDPGKNQDAGHQRESSQDIDSKLAKHQAMVAQAHAAQRSRVSSANSDKTKTSSSNPNGNTEGQSQLYIPRPPSNTAPTRKSATQAHRLARVSSLDTDGVSSNGPPSRAPSVGSGRVSSGGPNRTHGGLTSGAPLYNSLKYNSLTGVSHLANN